LRNRIICFGDVIDDIVVAPHGAIRPDTDTRAIIQLRPGGSAANTAAWLAMAGAAVDFIGVVGLGDADRHSAALRSVHAHLREHSRLPTGRIVIIVQGERRDMLTDRGANASLGPNDVTDELLSQAQLLHLTGHSLLNDAGVDGIRTLIQRCRSAGVLASVSPGSAGFIADLGAEKVLDAIGGANLIFSGYEDGRALAGEERTEGIAGRLSQKFDLSVVTAGSDSVSAATKESVVTLEIEAREVVDPTGAGDAFCAGFLKNWLEHRNLASALAAGAALATDAVQVMGGRPPDARLNPLP
jgi:sugar/nucleoside kinase (ribokinase family)